MTGKNLDYKFAMKVDILMRTKKVMQSALEETKLPSLYISVTDKPATCIDSKFGGIFYLPQEESIPTCSEGEQMQFLAQINFSKMPHIDGFPEKGLLQFFLDTDETRFEEKIDDSEKLHELYTVRFYPSPDVALQQDIDIQHFTPTKVITTVTINGETISKEEYEKRLNEASKKDEKPASVFLSMMEGKGIPQYKPSLLAELRRNAKFNYQTTPGHLDLSWLEGKMAFRSAYEVATMYLGLNGKVSDLGYEEICNNNITPEIITKQSGYDIENNESAIDSLCWDFGNWGTKVGGHPALHQIDNRLDVENGEKYNVLLFQYDFTTQEEMEKDTFQFFINQEDLKNAKFDDILLCHHNCF